MLLKDNSQFVVCKGCGEAKPVSEFYCCVTKNGNVYASTLCKECKKAKVREYYYTDERNKRRARRKRNPLKRERTEAQPEFYMIRDCVVYARLMYFDIVRGKWMNKFHPIIKMQNEKWCNQFLSIARDLSTGDLKRMARRFHDKHGYDLED